MKHFLTRCKPVVYITLFFVSWQFLGLYNLAYAFQDNLQNVEGRNSVAKKFVRNQFEQKVKGTRALLKEMADELKQGKTIKDKIKLFNSYREQLKKENDGVLKYFAGIRKHLIEKGLSKTILERHDKTVKKYKKKHKLLQKRLESVSKARKEKLKTTIAEAVEFLENNIHKKKHIPLDPNNLPHRMPEIKKRKPRTTIEEYLKGLGVPENRTGIHQKSGGKGFNKMIPEDGLKVASLDVSGLLANMSVGAIPPPGPDDLAETVEVQFTQSIQDLAAQLDRHPLKIYNWVRNNIEFVPTYGSIQGADMCLMTKQGNAFDTASLLIALLRASNVPARYVYGTVEIPIDKAMNWVGGVTDPATAGKILASGGIPTNSVYNGGVIEAVQIDHVWVEAFADYIPYRGAVKGDGDTWISLDASFKQYSYTEGIDTDSALPVDVNALLTEAETQSAVDEAIPSFTSLPLNTIQSQLQNYQNDLDTFLSTNYPDVTGYYELSRTLHGYKEIKEKEIRILPNTFSNHKLIARLDTFSEIPDGFRYKFGFKLDDIHYIVPSAALAGKRITVSYQPATSADAQVMSEADGILNLPIYLVNVIPELRVEGQVVGIGSPVQMGTDQNIEIEFYIPSKPVERIVNTIKAGEYYAVGLNLQKNPVTFLYDRLNQWEPDTPGDRDDRLGELLHLVSMLYFTKLDMFMNDMAQASDMVYLRFPAECMVGLGFETTSVYGVPVSVPTVSMNIDVDRDIISPFPKTGNEDSRVKFMLQKGIYSSSLEHFIFKQFLGLESVSAVKFMELASDQAIPVYTIDVENSERVAELQVSAETRQSINNFINAGYMVLVPQMEITYFDYTGSGFIAVDPETGAAGYMISGGLAGGSTVAENVDDILEVSESLLDNDYNFVTFLRWKSNIIELINDYPEIASQPNQEFNTWAKRAVLYGEMCKNMDYGRVKGVAGYMILYFTYINLLLLII